MMNRLCILPRQYTSLLFNLFLCLALKTYPIKMSTVCMYTLLLMQDACFGFVNALVSDGGPFSE